MHGHPHRREVDTFWGSVKRQGAAVLVGALVSLLASWSSFYLKLDRIENRLETVERIIVSITRIEVTGGGHGTQ